jgi:hypothetical protein
MNSLRRADLHRSVIKLCLFGFLSLPDCTTHGEDNPTYHRQPPSCLKQTHDLLLPFNQRSRRIAKADSPTQRRSHGFKKNINPATNIAATPATMTQTIVVAFIPFLSSIVSTPSYLKLTRSCTFNPFRLHSGNEVGLIQAAPLFTSKFYLKHHRGKDKHSNDTNQDQHKSSAS